MTSGMLPIIPIIHACTADAYGPKTLDDSDLTDNGLVFCKICQRSYVDLVDERHSIQ